MRRARGIARSTVARSRQLFPSSDSVKDPGTQSTASSKRSLDPVRTDPDDPDPGRRL